MWLYYRSIINIEFWGLSYMSVFVIEPRLITSYVIHNRLLTFDSGISKFSEVFFSLVPRQSNPRHICILLFPNMSLIWFCQYDGNWNKYVISSFQVCFIHGKLTVVSLRWLKLHVLCLMNTVSMMSAQINTEDSGIFTSFNLAFT